MNPQFKTEPYRHQLEAFERFKDSEYFFLMMEQRTGKTKIVLDIAAHKYRRGTIDSLLIIAPASVSPQWINDAIPEHMPDDVRSSTLLWRSSQMGTANARRRMQELLSYTAGLRVLATNIDALLTPSFRAYATLFYKKHRVMAVVDESVDIANFSSKRSKKAIDFARRSVARAAMDGTPLTAGPLGLFQQCEFLKQGALDFTSYYAFRSRYAEMEERQARGQTFKVVKRFVNVEELQAKLYRFSNRVLRSDCHDLPPKVRQKVYFDLSPEQARIYDELRETYVTELRSGAVVTADMVLTRYLRLAQVTSGFLPSDSPMLPCRECGGTDEDCSACEGTGVVGGAERVLEPLPGTNTRLAAYADAAKRLNGQGIVWCRWTYDVDAVLAWAKSEGLRTSRYDGKNKDDRDAQMQAFRSGRTDLFVGTPGAGGRGLELSCANHVTYYSHGWSLRQRLQSEDRAQSLTKQDAVLYVDLIATDTIDSKIVAALREGKRLSDLITGDRVEEWI